MERRVREDGVEELVKRRGERPRVGADEPPIGIRFPSALDHLRRRVEADDGRAALGDRLGQMARSTAQIEDPFACSRVDQIDDALAVLVDERVIVVVRVRAPLPVRRSGSTYLSTVVGSTIG